MIPYGKHIAIKGRFIFTILYYKRMRLRSKSIAVLTPVESIEAQLKSLGFIREYEATVVSDGKFWRRMLFTKGCESVSISEEIGYAYPKDPIISMYATDTTIDKISEVLR